MSDKKVVISYKASHLAQAQSFESLINAAYPDLQVELKEDSKTPSLDARFHFQERTFIVMHNSNLDEQKALKVLESLQNL